MALSEQATRKQLVDEQAFGPDHPNVARDVNNLGSVMKALGDLTGARTACERALGILEKFLPPGHPDIKAVQGFLENLGERVIAATLDPAGCLIRRGR